MFDDNIGLCVLEKTVLIKKKKKNGRNHFTGARFNRATHQNEYVHKQDWDNYRMFKLTT